MIGETGERKSAVATPDGKSRKKKKKESYDQYIGRSGKAMSFGLAFLWIPYSVGTDAACRCGLWMRQAACVLFDSICAECRAFYLSFPQTTSI